VQRYTESISFDRRLWPQDVRGSLAHAKMLRKIGLLTARELADIQKGFAGIVKDIEAGKFEWKESLEDVHMNLESELTRRTPAGAKLHTGRSRNDQVATDLRLWTRDEVMQQADALRALQSALVRFAERSGTVMVPGYTHLQRGQPVLFAHHLLAYVEMLDRDLGRFRDTAERANVCPLGSGALAGSTIPLDREFVAKELGFVDAKGRPRVTQNSMDGVADRDFVIEFLSAAALLAVHLSRLCEDVILWSSAEFGFVRIGDAYTTGSSLMPQKKNPDIAELARGKTGRVVGALVSALTLVKGLPLTYNRDLQEDKERLFDAADTTRESLLVLAEMFDHTVVVPAACERAVGDPLLLATDVAEALVRQGVPFRDAHHLTGAAVGLAAQLGKPLNTLTDAEWSSLSPHLVKASKVMREPLTKRIAARITIGAPAPASVKRQLATWKRRLG
jgi:argininosuccinate lyase